MKISGNKTRDLGEREKNYYGKIFSTRQMKEYEKEEENMKRLFH